MFFVFIAVDFDISFHKSIFDLLLHSMLNLCRWAWQNTHLTRHIADEKRIIKRKTTEKRSPKTGRTRRRPARPRMSLVDKLANLYLLLQAPSFARWPLEVRFFCEDIYRSWQKRISSIEGDTHRDIYVSIDFVPERPLTEGPPIRSTHKIHIGERKPPVGQGGIEGLNVSYAHIIKHLEKSISLLTKGERINCAVCAETMQLSVITTLVCPNENCRSISHLHCLATRFLNEETDGDLVVPANGTCPGCNLKLRWIDLVQEMSVRTRGEREISRLMKKRKYIKSKTADSTKALTSKLVAESSNDEAPEYLDYSESDVEDEPSLENEWDRDCNEHDDTMSVTSTASSAGVVPRVGTRHIWNEPPLGLDIVIEDSEWDGAEVLD